MTWLSRVLNRSAHRRSRCAAASWAAWMRWGPLWWTLPSPEWGPHSLSPFYAWINPIIQSIHCANLQFVAATCSEGYVKSLLGSTGHWAVVSLACCSSKQTQLSGDILQKPSEQIAVVHCRLCNWHWGYFTVFVQLIMNELMSPLMVSPQGGDVYLMFRLTVVILSYLSGPVLQRV